MKELSRVSLLVVRVGAVLVALCLHLLGSSSAVAQGRPDILWMAGGHYIVDEAVYSPDGTNVVTLGGDQTVKIWDVQSGLLLRTIDTHQPGGYSIAISPNGQLLAVGGNNALRLWDIQTGHVVFTLKDDYAHDINSVAFSPDGLTLASGEEYDGVNLWDVQSGTLLGTLGGQPWQVRSVAFSPDGSTLASSSYDRTIKFWNYRLRAQLGTITDPNQYLESLRFSPDGQTLAAGSNILIKLWDVETRTLRASCFGHTNTVNSIVFSQNGQNLVSGSRDGTIKIWNQTGGAAIRSWTASVYSILSVAYSPSSGEILSGSNDSTAKIWDVATGALTQTLGNHKSQVASVAFSPTGMLLASAAADSTTKIWNSHTGALVRTLASSGGGVNSVTFSPDGQNIATASFRKVEIWDPDTGGLVRTLAKGDSVGGVAYSPNGRIIAGMGTRFPDTSITLWNALTGATLHSIADNGYPFTAIAFSPDGSYLAAASSDGSVTLYDPESVAVIHVLSGPRAGDFGSNVCLAFSPNSQILAAGDIVTDGDARIRIWDVPSGVLTKTISGIAQYVICVAFSPDGTSIACGLRSNPYVFPWEPTFQIWDAASGDLLQRYDEEVSYRIETVSYSPDGGQIAVGRPDATVMMIRNPNDSNPLTLRVNVVDPLSVSQLPLVSLRIFGAGYVSGATCFLRRSGHSNVLPRGPVTRRSMFNMEGTFDLSDVAPGRWDVVAKLPDGREATKLNALEIIEGTGTGVLTGTIGAPTIIRAGRTSAINVGWSNFGTGDIDTPLLLLEALDRNGNRLDVPMRFSPADNWTKGAVMLMGGKGQTLNVGSFGNAMVQFQAPFLAPHDKVHWKLSQVIGFKPEVYANGWESLKNFAKPIDATDEAWNHVWGKLATQFGPDPSSFMNLLRSSSTYSAARGETVLEASKLLTIPLANSDGQIAPGVTIETSTDIAAPAKGLPLVFTRMYSSMIIPRFNSKYLGRGWTHNYDIWTENIQGGIVAIHYPDGRSRIFSKGVTGEYVASPGDSATFVDTGQGPPHNQFILTEKDGTKVFFNYSDQISELQDPNGSSFRVDYNLNGTISQVYHYTGGVLTFEYTGGRLDRVRGPANRSVTFTYDGDFLAKARLEDGRETTYTYNGDLLNVNSYALTKVTAPDGRERNITYNSGGIWSGGSLTGGAFPTSIAYPDKGIVNITGPSGTVTVDRGSHGLPVKSVDLLGQTSSTMFDVFLNANSGSRAGRSWSSASDEKNNLLEGTDPAGKTRGASYTTSLNRLDWFRDAKNNVLDYAYDNKGNVTRITYPDGPFETFTYEPWGAVRTHTNRRGQTKTMGYNPLGLLTSVVGPGESLSYDYDARGNQISAQSSVTGTITMGYDNRDFLRRVDYPGGQWFEYDYDAVGRRTESRSSLGTTLTYFYDQIGRLFNIKANGQNLVTYTFDTVGRLASETRGNGTSTTYAYDGVNRPTQVKHFAPGGALQAQYLYGAYDLFGNPHTLTTPAGVWNFAYDATNQLTGITNPAGVASSAVYDNEGNRMSIVDGGVTTNYTVNNLNQYGSAGAETFTYDADGNVVTRTVGGQTTSYTWDSGGRLVGVLMPNGDTYAYEYDALGHRSKATINGVVTRFVYDGGSLAGELDGSGSMQVRYLSGAGLVARQDAGSIGYYGFDATGHTRLLTGSNGSVLNTYEYSPFGVIASMSETVPNRFRYVGKFGVSDDPTGLMHMGARYYDAGLGRFVSPDPAGLTGRQSNLYSYCFNSPLRYMDSTGGRPELVREQFTWGEGTILDSLNLEPTHMHIYDFEEGYNIGFGPNPYGFGYGRADSYPGTSLPPWVNAATLKYTPDYPGPITKESDALRRAFIEMERDGWNDEIYGLANCQDWAERIWQLYLEKLKENMDAVEKANAQSEVVYSNDPNEKDGPIGSGIEGWIAPDLTMTYTIRFENLPAATASAQEVVVTDTLDPNLDISTMALADILIGNQTVGVLSGYQEGSFRIPLANSSLLLDGHVTFDLNTRKITWTLKAVDPLTGELPEGIEGLLPPNDPLTGSGEGYVRFTIKPKANTPNGTIISNQGHIKFDLNDVISTNVWTNKIGRGVIDSKVLPLPAGSPYRFTVTWTGTETGGPGIASYDIFASKDGAPYYLWKDDTTALSAEFVGAGGSTYRFYSVATDLNGQVEAAPFTADASTTTGVMTAYVESFVATQGMIIGGGLAELLVSDDQYLNTFADETSYTTTVALTGRFYGATTLPAKLKVTIEAAVGARGLSQVVQLFNYTTNTWQNVDQRSGPSQDTVVVYASSLNGRRFVAQDGTVRARVRCALINDEDPSADGWVSRIDFVKWELLPVRN